MNKHKSQSGFAHLAIIIVLVVLLLGALGFVYWQNFMQPKTSDENVIATKTADDTTTITTTPAETNAGYLVLDDWGVKFKLPSNIGTNKITYRKVVASGGLNEHYAISTERISALGGSCANLFQLYRSTEPFDSIAGAPGLAGKVGEYYYGFQGPQAACSDSEEAQSENGKDIQNEDFYMLQSLLKTVEAK